VLRVFLDKIQVQLPCSTEDKDKCIQIWWHHKQFLLIKTDCQFYVYLILLAVVEINLRKMLLLKKITFEEEKQFIKGILVSISKHFCYDKIWNQCVVYPSLKFFSRLASVPKYKRQSSCSFNQVHTFCDLPSASMIWAKPRQMPVLQLSTKFQENYLEKKVMAL